MRDLAISTIGSIVAAIIWAVLAEFTKASAVEHLLNIAKALAPVWAGLGAFFIIRAALFLPPGRIKRAG
jgi:predicted lysophospholipase L1 biosynthesis ABC-type transport system permease subunit